MTAGEYLVDTNVLVYAYDRSDPAKQRRAFDVLNRLAAANQGVLSAQILSEFFVVVTRKIPNPVPVAAAAHSVENYLRSWQVMSITPPLIYEALRGVNQHQMSYWDALVWATAKLNQVPVVLSEDFQHGRILEGVRFMSPFSDGFDVSSLGSPPA
jgi:predicted nucleic acid-binding protein